jgi:crotonobetainyl-CoA:carnitine CoA-transferase CaiB-like acyl-CoA transferase
LTTNCQIFRLFDVDERPKPLADVRIVAIEQYGAGPFGSMHLAELGADVIKIEDPSVGGDVGRYVPPFQHGEDSLFFQTFNRNKRSLSLDISSPAGRQVLEDLLRVSDVAYSNLRGDVVSRLGLRYADLAHVNPRLVCCSLSGFGLTGPRAAEPAYDYILQGMAGWMSLTGDPENPPVRSGLSLVDYCGGMVAAMAVLAGVHAARRDGVGLDCDLSLFDVAVSMLTYVGTWHLNGGYEPVRTAYSAHPSLVPFQNFETADGWIVIGCAKEKFWRRLAEVLGRSELATDPRFDSFATRRENAPELLALLQRIVRTETSAHWLDKLMAAGVPCGPVNSLAEALADPQTAARGLVIDVEHPDHGTLQELISPVRVGEEPAEQRRAPTRNEHAAPILGEMLGYSLSQIEDLAERGAFSSSRAPVAES